MKIAKKSVLAVLICLLLASLSAFVALQTLSVKAVEDNVLPENTAEYTFENDSENPWVWDRETNEWASSYNYSSNLQLNVTQKGNIVFEYISVGATNNNGPTDYLTISKNEEELISKEYEAGEYHSYSIAVEESDIIKFSYQRKTNGRQDCFAKIKGLSHKWQDQTQNEITLNIDGAGTVAIGESEEYSTDAAQQVVYGGAVMLKAKATDGNIFYGWYKDGVLASVEKEFNLKNVFTAGQYTAKFVSTTHDEETLDGWTKSGTSYNANIDINKTLTLTKEIKGTGYLQIKYSALWKTFSSETFSIILDGKILASTPAYKATAVQFSITERIDENELHLLKVVLTTANATVNTKVNITNLTIETVTEESLNFQTVNVKWNEKFGDVYYLEGSKVTSATSNDVVVKGVKLTENSIKLPQGKDITLWAVPRPGVASSIAEGRWTNSAFMGYFVDEAESAAQTAVPFAGTMGTDNFADGKTIEVRFVEVVPTPEISLTKTIGIKQDKVSIEGGEILKLPANESNNLVFQIKKYGKTDTEALTAKFNGTDQKVDNEFSDSFGVVLSNVKERGKLELTIDYGKMYSAEAVTIQIEITTPNDVQDLVFEGAEITAENDPGYYPWVYDPKISTDGLAYTSGISYGATPIARYNAGHSDGWDCPGTYIKFTVKGSGSFTFDFYIDGGYYSSSSPYTSWAGYSFTKPESASAGDKWLCNSATSGFESTNSYGPTDAYNLAHGVNPSSEAGAPHVDAVIDAKGDQAQVSRIRNNENWFSCTIPITGKDDGVETTIYILHAYPNLSSSKYFPLNQMSVRNVKFFSGNVKVNWGVKNGENLDKPENGTVKATVGGEEKTSGKEIPAGSLIHFAATPTGENMQFYCWIDKEGKVLSYEQEFDYPLAGSELFVYAVIDEKNAFEARIGGRYYNTLAEAVTGSKAGDEIILLKSATLSQSIEIKAGVSLILPIHPDGTYYEMGETSNASPSVSWDSQDYKTPVCVLTVDQGVQITVNGSLYVGGVLHYPEQYPQGHTSGAYTQLILNGDITVNNGGLLDVYGRVTGDGSITIESGGVMYQPFIIFDYNGGTNTEAMFSAGVTPFKLYAMINVQNKGGYTIKYGGELYGHASLYFLSSITTLDTQFISYEGNINGKPGTTTLINLSKEGSYVHGVYHDDHARPAEINNNQSIGNTVLTIHGDAKAGYMDFLGLVQTNGVAFSLPYNYELILEDGNFEMAYSYKLMPGSILKVQSGATLTVKNNAGLYVYDSFFGPNVAKRAYPTGENLKAAGYNPYASLIVNGKLVLESGTTFVGTVQNEGTGSIEIKEDVKLSADLFDGVATKYSCNYTEYTLIARVWDSAHGEMRQLEAGKTYNAVACESWTLPGILFKYDANTAASGDHSHKTNLAEKTTANAEGLKGSWTVDGHSEHTFDWTTLTENSGADAENPVKRLTHRCTEIGCTQTEQKTLLYLPETFSVDYKGSEYSIDDIKSVLFGKHSGFETTNVTVVLGGGDFTVQGAYTAQLTLADGYFFLDGKTLITEKTINWNIQQYELTEANVEITESPENIIYKGTEWQPTYTVTWDNEPEINLNSDYSVRWENNTNASGEAKLIITGIGQFTGEVTITFTIKPKDITVTITTPQPTTYTGELQKFEHVDQDGNDLSKYTIGEDLYGSDKLKITLTAEGTDAGDYPISGVSANTNYNVTFTPANYTIKPAPVTFSLEEGQNYEYTGSKIEPGVKAVWGGSKTLDAGEYSIAYGENTNVGGTNNVVITITGKNFTVTEGEKTKTLEFGITPKSIVGATVKVTQEYTYTGEAITPTTDKITVTLTDWNKEITFKVSSYSNNTNASAVAQVTVEGTGNYTGTATGNFTIAPKSIDGATVTVTTPAQDIIYKNAQWQPAFTVTVTGIDGNLAVDTDYTVQYGENKTVKEGGTITVNGKGNFTGTATQTFEIKSKDVTVTVIGGNIAYGEEPKAPYEVNIVGLLNDVTEDSLKAMLDYTLTKPQALSVGNEYKVEVKFKEGESLDNYTVKFTPGTFTIVDKEYSEIKFTGATNVTYDGKTHALTLTGLPDGASYKLTYTKGGSGSENAPQDVGEYTVTAVVTLTNGATYDKLQSATLTITPATVTFSLEKDSYEYTGSKIEPAVTAKWGAEGANTLEQSGNFTVEYGENTNVKGTNNVKITLTNTNFTGDTTLTFEITAKSISGAKVEVAGSYTYTGEAITPTTDKITVTLTGWEHDITFSVTYGENINVKDNGTVTVTGTGNYEGTATGNFTIVPKSIDGATVTVTTPAQEIIYKNEQWQPAITVKVNGITNALTGNDYNVSYGKNTKVGEGTISVEGKGNFTGTAKTTFTILQKGVQITLKAQTAVYDGTEQSVSSDSVYWEATGIIEGDDLQVELQGSRKDVGSAAINVKSINANYKIENGDPTGTFTVTAKSITVKIKDQSAEYTNSVPTVDQSNEAWESEGVCGTDDLHITITKAPGVQAGGYELTGGYSNPNYTVKFVNEDGEEKSATFTITKKAVTVTIADKSSVYGDELAELTYTYSGLIAGDGFDINDYVSLTTDAERYSAISGSYKITAEIKEAINYTISAADAEYTLTARPVKYTITNQSTVYSGAVPEVEQKYSITEGEVVNGDSVGITVKAAGITKDVGKYEITGEWSNKNYAVEFVPGEYEITRLDISGNITISVNDETDIDENDTLKVQYAGESLAVSGMAYSEITGDEELEITVETDMTEITGIGNYTVKATINDKNYAGEKSFTVIVSDEKGYTANLYSVLEEIEELGKGINPDDYKEGDFEKLKAIQKAISGLTAEERAVASEELAEYEQLIEAWNNGVEVDGEVVETAKAIADAPVSALIVAASVSAIAALAYVIGKGGRII